MTDFTVTITDPDQLAGITWARGQHNATLPPPDPDAGTVAEPIETDEEYIQWVMEQAAASYVDQQLLHQYQQQYNTAVRKEEG